MKLKKESLIVVFYVMYFSWLFTITYLTQDVKVLNPFAFFIAIFYFLFLHEKGDILWFLLGVLISLVLPSYTGNGETYLEIFANGTHWLPITWGTTIVALRKLVLVVER